MDALRWQLLLGAELSAAKSQALLRELGSFAGDPRDVVKKTLLLSDQDRQKILALDSEKLRKALSAGVSIVERHQFTEPMLASDYPPALFCWGDWSAAAQPCLSIVGTRAATIYGKAVAMKFAEAFARAGVTVVSGGALGIDAAAHRGSLAEGGKTIAVLAGGIEQVYPAMHASLFSKIREHGCLVSQHAVGSRPSPFRFLSRNTLIAALSIAVVVVEAPARSGALRTVHAALDQGKQVFVVPANIDNTNFAGSHALIRDGATLVDHPDQVLETLGIASGARREQQAEVSHLGKKILETLRELPLTTEFIVQKTGIDTAEVMAELTMLELDGLILRDGGKYMVKF